MGIESGMSYQVLARKWRPRTFREMVGQEHVLQALINALDHNRLHHAYLFTGTRGVGKTTIARILAKCLNCETGVSSEPCGQCSSCVELAEGRFIDLIEVDAASRTKVEDTRDLLENVQYAPTRGRYKVYLIDEVHMLSNSSFNALLKTLEEPPPHVKFLLATTDPQKLPVTVLSRCLQFNLKNMNPERIVSHLQFVLGKEMVPFEESALWQLGRSADGSMRDALSLTDQAIAFGNGKVSEADVRSMLGTIDQVLVYDILSALASLNGKEVLNAVARLSEHAPDYSGALAELLSVLHRVAIGQALPEAVDNSSGDRDRVLELSQKLSIEDVQLFYQTALLGRRDLPLAPDPRSGFEMVLLRMLAFKPQGVHHVPTQALPAPSETVTEPQSNAVESSNAAQHDAAQNVTQSPTENNGVAQASALENTTPKQHTPLPVPENTQLAPVAAEPIAAAPAAEPMPWDDAVLGRTSNQADPSSGLKVESNTESTTALNSEPSSETAHAISEVAEPPSSYANDPSANAGNSSMSDNNPPQSEQPPMPDEAPDGYGMGRDSDAYESNAGSNNASNNTFSEPSPPKKIDAAPTALSAADSTSASQGSATPRPANQSAAENLQPQDNNSGYSGSNTDPAPAKVIAEDVPRVSLDDVTPAHWPQIYVTLKVGGVLQATVANCLLTGRQGNALQFLLDHNNSTLYDPSHQQRLADLLTSYFIEPIQVQITLGQVTADTPAVLAVRARKERLAGAVNAMQTDPIVRQLIEQFSGVLIEDSVKPID